MITYKKLFLLLIILTLINLFTQKSNSKSYKDASLQPEIASKILRFHVVANSNSDYDQHVKLTVKKEVLNYLAPLVSESTSLDNSVAIINNNMNAIIDIANATLKANNAPYSASASICTREFPIKVYGDMTLPEGSYNALCIDLGGSNGKNWWCVLYPTLCFTDNTYSTLPSESKEKLHNALTKEEYDSIINNDTQVKFRLKLVDMVKSLLHSFACEE